MKLSSHKNFFGSGNSKGIYSIWVRLESKQAELKQRVKVSLAKYVTMFHHDYNYNIRFILTYAETAHFFDFQIIKAF